MDIRGFLKDLENKPLFYMMFCPDSELRPIYINKFAEAHQGKVVYREDPIIGKQPRTIGKKPVYVVVDWEQGLKKPKAEYMNTNVPMLVLYTSKEPSEQVAKVYGEHIVVIPPVTGEQAANLLSKLGLSTSIIDYLKEKTSGTQEAILLGKQVLSLANDLNMSVEECFDTYFKLGLKGRNVDEEPTEFLEGVLNKDFNYVFNYLLEQRGNEFFIFGCLLNWLEEVIRFCSCTGDYWNDAGLVKARWAPFQAAKVNRVPFLKWIRLHERGLAHIQSTKINEPDPSSPLEVYVCRIIQTLL